MKVERVSYPVITPSAERGLLEASLYKAQCRWNIFSVSDRGCPTPRVIFVRDERETYLLGGGT